MSGIVAIRYTYITIVSMQNIAGGGKLNDKCIYSYGGGGKE